MKKRDRKARNKKGDIAINLVLIIVIAVISIFLLIGLFATKLPGFSKSLYCKTFFHVYSKTFVPSGLRVDPEYCQESAALRVDLITNSTMGNQSSGATLEETFRNSIVAYSFACWKETDFGRLTERLLCFELTTPPNMPQVQFSERDATDLMLDNNLCDAFPNDDERPTCGSEDRLEFLTNPLRVEGRTNLLIEYDGTQVLVS